jgi:hypothetical protein
MKSLQSINYVFFQAKKNIVPSIQKNHTKNKTKKVYEVYIFYGFREKIITQT